jgi:hypothetical protein
MSTAAYVSPLMISYSDFLFFLLLLVRCFLFILHVYLDITLSMIFVDYLSKRKLHLLG